MSWLYNHRDQLDGYELYAEIAYRFRPKVLPDDRNDIEIEIVLKLKAEADRHDQVTIGFLYAVARNIVRTYWRKKYRERRRISHLYEGDKGEMIADGWKLVSYDPDIEARLDAQARLKTLPERMVKAGTIRDDGGKLNNADKLYLSRRRRRSENYYHTTEAEAERIRRLYVEEGLPTPKIAQITGRANYTVQRTLSKLGVKLHGRGGRGGSH